MKNSYLQRINTALDAITGELPKNTPELEKCFIHHFYAKLAARELEMKNPKIAAELARSAYEFMHEREQGTPKIRVFHSKPDRKDAESEELIIELINDDKPFLVDSLSAALSRLGFTIYETIHPMFSVLRDKNGVLKQVGDLDRPAREEKRESFIHFKLSPLPEEIDEAFLKTELERVLTYVRAAVADWKDMLARCKSAEDALRAHLDKIEDEHASEVLAFLGWLRDRNFVFLGFSDGDEKLGVSSLEESAPLRRDGARLITITKSDRPSLVHRPVLMDVIAVHDPASDKFYQFTGLYTSSVYYQSAEIIPIVRQKLHAVVENAGYHPNSHDGKALKTILEFFPRDEMFQYDEQDLFKVALGLVSLEDRPGVRLFARHDPFERFVNCMVFVPREYFSTELRITIIQNITKAFQGKLENFYTQITESPLARLHIIIRTTPGFIPEVDIKELESEIARFTLLWSDELRKALREKFGEKKSESYMRRYGNAFPAAYVNRYSINATVFDIEKCVEACNNGTLAVDFYRTNADPESFHLKLYSPGEEIALSDIIPVLENMGFRAIDEHPFLIRPVTESGGECVDIWIRDFKLKLAEEQPVALDQVKAILEEAILKVWRNEMESDRFNALVIKAGLHWRQVVMVRAYARYLRQIVFPYAQASIENAMNGYPQLAKNIVALFMARFDPHATDHQAKQEYLLSQIENQLSQVESLSHDRILRQYTKLIQSTLRTNFFQQEEDGVTKTVLSFKIRSHDVPGIPKPIPFAEIFVYGTRVEGIHLRGGKVARGGLRWSDRLEDFRTEILGLMKAQMVKNSVIVPVGSKGGFVVKQPPTEGGREAFQNEGITCYRMYLSGLLDITDNVVEGKVVPPQLVVRYDEDDPYLVVAADKGTATFSDIANEMSQSYGFWLDDAFASGGSAGYDHKKMGITARGAWVSVVRHFLELGKDIDKEEFTVVGIGDMSGDVFGNGMLLSENIRLVAAFNHMHIFIDPAPDAKASFKERKRLFELPRSTWKDYDDKLISKGGGVYERSAKVISLSKEAREALGISKQSLSPDELIQGILKSPVELLWNGGIGTYVKSSAETHEDVGDRTNNALRVNAGELRCKIVGEGGNLGFTQRGRIEYAGNGGRINTDAIDNSGGVDCSDHEVNIKLAFARSLVSGELERDDRNALLVTMSEEVAGLVLKDNFLQTQAISMAEARGAAQLEPQTRLMQRLEEEGILDRALEYLPNEKRLEEMRASGHGLSRPELAVLLSYAKIALYNEILESSLPDEAYFAVDLARYFPKKMQEDFMEAINAHPLRREIIATVATNSLVNRAGITFFFDMQENLAKPTREVAAAYTFSRDLFLLRPLWSEIEQKMRGASVDMQIYLLLSINHLIEHVTLWALRYLPNPINVEASIAAYRKPLATFMEEVDSMHSKSTQEFYEETYARFKESGVPDSLAKSIARLDMLAAAPDIIDIAESSKKDIALVGSIYFELGDRLELEWIKLHAHSMGYTTRWDRQALNGLIQEINDQQRRLTTAILEKAGKDADAKEAIESWLGQFEETLARYSRTTDDLVARGEIQLPALMVVLKHLRMLG